MSVLRVDYYTYTRFTNGTLTITMPLGITVTTSDSVAIGSWRPITSSEISADGRTITFSGINIGGDFAFTFRNKTFSEGIHILRAQGDADGPGTSYSADDRTITVVAN